MLLRSVCVPSALSPWGGDAVQFSTVFASFVSFLIFRLFLTSREPSPEMLRRLSEGKRREAADIEVAYAETLEIGPKGGSRQYPQFLMQTDFSP